MFDLTNHAVDSSTRLALLLVNLLFFTLPLRAKWEMTEEKRREKEARDGRVMFPLLLRSFEPRRVKKKRRGSCNRPPYISVQMRTIWVWVRKQHDAPHECSTSGFLTLWICSRHRALNLNPLQVKYKLIAFLSHLWCCVQIHVLTGRQMKGDWWHVSVQGATHTWESIASHEQQDPGGTLWGGDGAPLKAGGVGGQAASNAVSIIFRGNL